MLEVKDLKKIYKTKNGADVNALDGVSLQFPETGMVFLLGKSGSGKSTLLNVCGGLDSPTEGEIIVKGRSSKDFKQSDFDSYRNTFIGFIFQEYNILNEFSVEDNIALALELQGKSKDKAAIDALLDDVDLQGFAKRKPNTLSGGQKQRIAIARALIKAPEIIMADEPTGALDSNTGKQVFETLKKLSRNKLVIVVSHDRDFAEQYGDRIIELKDGKVLSDVTKTQLEQQALSDNVNAVGDVLCIKRGTALTDQDFEKIKEFLKKSDDDVLIANNEKDIRNFKKVSRINDNGEKEVFCDTDFSKEEKKQYSKEDSRFIRSKLPIRHAIRIGVSGLRSKPVRLFFTVILCTVAFMLFGLLSTLNFYDSEATFKQTMADTGPSVMQLQKQYRAQVSWYTNGKKDYDYESYYDTRFTDAELTEYAASLSPDAFGGIKITANFNIRQAESEYWVNSISTFAVLPENNSLRDKINGEYPKSKNEIVISSYTADVLYNCKVYDSDGKLLELSAPEDIIGKLLAIGGNFYKVTGIMDSGAVSEQYAPLKDAPEPNNSLIMKYNAYLQDGLHLIAFVSPDRLEALAAENAPYSEGVSNYTSAAVTLPDNGTYQFPDWSNAKYLSISELGADQEVFSVVSGKTTPADNEALLSSNMFGTLVREAYYKMAEAASQGEDYTLADKYYAAAELGSALETGGIYKQNSETGKDEFIAFSDTELDKKIEELIAAVKRDNISLKLGLKSFDEANQTALGETEEFDIIAVYKKNSAMMSNGVVVLSDASFSRLWDVQKTTIQYYSELSSEYKEDPNALYGVIYLPYEHSEQVANTYWDIYSSDQWREDGSRTSLSGNFIGTLQSLDSIVQQLSQIFLYIGLVLAVFAVLLFSNFISVSISQKKREIGILRAVGARSADVFKIFFSESFVIAAICIVLSTAASIVVCSFINKGIASELGASLFVFGAASFAILVAIALLTAVAATFLPVYNAARKKPVDSIRSL